MHPYVRGSSVHNTQDVEATSMSISKLMAKEDVLHTYFGKYSAVEKNETMPLAATWMQLEVIILGEESQKEKDKYHMISQMWSLKYDTTICETETDSQT